MSLVDVEGLNVAFGHGTVPVVRDVSFTVGEGECLAIVGESGSGKSVTARTLLGLAGKGSVVSATRLRIGGQDTLRFRQRDWRRLRGSVAGMVLQDSMVSLDPLRRIGAEIGEPIRLHTRSTSAERERRVVDLLADAGVPDPEARRTQYPHELSGGLRQRALIASALAARPRLLIADEPTTALDVLVQEQILKLLRRITDEGRGLLLISHDLAVVARLADRIAVMHNGVLVETGPPDQVLNAPAHPYTRLLINAVPARRASALDRRIGAEVLRLEGIRKSYRPGARAAADDVSFSLHAGETLALVGESGSGKSTVARIATGLLAPDEGQVLLVGRPWSGGTERARRPRRNLIQLIHQNPHAAFDPRFTVAKIIGEGLPALTRRARARRVVELLETVGLDAGFAARRPHQLSGGQRQRVAIARALAPGPQVLICDEPVSALDASVQAQVLELLDGLRRDNGIATLFITHDLGVVSHLGDRVLVMKDGTVVEEGDVTQIFERPHHPYTRALLAAVPTRDGTLDHTA